MADETVPIADQAKEIPPVTGIIPIFLTKIFGPSYRTTLSGYAAGLGGILLALSPFLNGRRGQIFGAIGAVLAGGGIQQVGQHSKDKAVTGVEPKQ